MFAVSFAGVMAGDATMFLAGRVFGDRILRFRPIARVMTPARFQVVEKQFEKYGNWVLFVARFMPGLRSPIFMTAGITRKVSFLRFFLMDGAAALISVPVWVYMGFYGANNHEWLMNLVKQSQTGVLLALAAICCVLFVVYFLKKRKQTSKET